MTLAIAIQEGVAKFQLRVVIEGHPEQFVSSAAMESNTGDGRVRLVGLKIPGVVFGARVDLPTGKLDAKGMSLLIEGSREDFACITALRKKPTLRTYLRQYVSISATTIPVFSTDGWPSSGYLHIGTEAIKYTGTTSDSFTGCTRGYWDSAAQAHFVQGDPTAFEADAAGLQYPHVTDRPQAFEGRRAFFYLYTEGDGVGGDGTLRWVGLCTTQPRFEGPRATMSVDPITSILKQQIGGDVARRIPIRGIYYPWSAPFVLVLQLCSGASDGEPDGAVSTNPVFALVTGHYETEEAFCAQLTTKIATAVAAWGASFTGAIRAQVRVDGRGFELVYSTASSPRYVSLQPIGGIGFRAASLMLRPDDRAGPGAFYPHDVLDHDSRWLLDGASTTTSVVAANSTYRVRFLSTFPRAYFGDVTPWTEIDGDRGIVTVPSEADTNPGTRIYLGGIVALDSSTLLGGDSPEASRYYSQVYSFDAATRSIRMGAGRITIFRQWNAATRFRLGRKLTEGNVGDLLSVLVGSSPLFCNAGAMPLIRDTEMVVTGPSIDASIAARLVSDRVFLALGQDVTLEELVSPELAAAGMHWTISTSGVLSVRRVRLAARTDAASHSIVQTKTVGPLPTLEEAAIWGFVSQLKVAIGYDPIQDDWAAELIVNNVGASAPNRDAKTFTIEQRSMSINRFLGGPLEEEPSIYDAQRLARVWLGLLGGSYDILTIQVPLHFFDAVLGDAVQVTSPFVVADDGTMGITAKLGILIGYSWEIESGTGTLEILLHSRNVVGYAPGFRVTSQVNISGNTWDLTLNVAEVTSHPLSTWFPAGELGHPHEVKAIQQDSTSPTEVAGTVQSITGSVARVTFGLPWTPGTNEWALEPETSPRYEAAMWMARFLFVAHPSGRIDHMDVNTDARVLV